MDAQSAERDRRPSVGENLLQPQGRHRRDVRDRDSKRQESRILHRAFGCRKRRDKRLDAAHTVSEQCAARERGHEGSDTHGEGPVKREIPYGHHQRDA